MSYSGTERSLMNIWYQKTFSSCEENSLKYPYWYFCRKRINFFWVWGQKVKKENRFNIVKSTELFIFGIGIVEKCLVRGLLTNFIKKSPILGTLQTIKTLFIPTTEFVLLRRFVWTPIWPYFERWFFDQKSGKIGQNSKILLKSS